MSEIIWCSMMPSGMTMTVSSEGFTGGLLLRDGDLIAAGFAGDYFFMYKQSDGASLELREEDGRLILSGKTISIDPEYHEGCWEWLDQASSNDLRSLRFLMLPEDLDESHLPTLRKLASVNLDLSLGISGWSRSISNSNSAVALFKPRMLILGSSATAAELSGILAGQNQIETLFIAVADAENLDFLATLPNLRRLIIEGWDPATTGPLPKGMRALKSLLLSDSEILDASALAAVPEGIEELSLVMCGEITSLSGFERFSNLRTLILSMSGGGKDLATLRGMKKLAWVGLPPEITQEQFSVFVGDHPALKIVELIGCSQITDLYPLQHLTGLTGLIVGQYSGTFDVVDHLKSLEFLGLPKENFDGDPDEIARIREALPRALVVPVCLGSGWILLVIPLAALTWIVGSGARRRRHTSSRYGILSGLGKQP